MELSAKFSSEIEDVLSDEFSLTRMMVELPGGNESFCIKPTYSFAVSGDPYVVYGIFNRATGVREADTTQYAAAKEWVQALTRIALGEKMPGLGGHITTLSDHGGNERGKVN